jgi:signal peptidase I
MKDLHAEAWSRPAEPIASPSPPSPRPRSRPLGVVISFFVPGGGLAYLGRDRLGWLVLALALALVLLIPLGAWALGVWLAALAGNWLAPLVVRPGEDRLLGGLLGNLALRFGVAVVVVSLLRFVWVEAYRIPAGSMLPTLTVGDHIYVAKYSRFFGPPARGDVIVFTYPRERDKDFIKRVVAVAGDRLEVKNHAIVLNGERVPRELVPGPCRYEDFDEQTQLWDEKPCVAYRERLGDRAYTVQVDEQDWSRDFPGPDDPSPYVVPEGTVFVMGDNRNNSHDSRYWGPVPLDNVKGRALYVWWSSGPKGLRSERLGRRIE